MKIQKLLYILPIFLVGCEYPIHGTLQVNSTFPLKDLHHHSFELAPGDHAMEIKPDRQFGKNVLKLKLLDGAGKKRKLKIRIPHYVSIPEVSGTFALDSTMTGQPFDLTGKVETIEENQPAQVYSRPCNYHYGYYYDYYTGTRIITAHQRDKTAHFVVDFKTAGKDEALAQYHGTHTESELIYDSVGPCISP